MRLTLALVFDKEVLLILLMPLLGFAILARFRPRLTLLLEGKLQLTNLLHFPRNLDLEILYLVEVLVCLNVAGYFGIDGRFGHRNGVGVAP